MFFCDEHFGGYFMDTSHIIIDYNIAPDVFKRVITAKKLIASGKCKSVAEALEQVRLSRTAFYKYKNYIFARDEAQNGSIATLAFTLDDVTGILSEILKLLASENMSVLTINQNIPINSVANITISLRINEVSTSIDDVIVKLKKLEGVNKVHLLAMS